MNREIKLVNWEIKGVASWYGAGFAGKKTASSEVFNPEKLTAASRDLPLGSHVLVTNLNNGRSVRVKINDCGPYVDGRDIDLSRKAARRLNFGVEPAVPENELAGHHMPDEGQSAEVRSRTEREFFRRALSNPWPGRLRSV